MKSSLILRIAASVLFHAAACGVSCYAATSQPDDAALHQKLEQASSAEFHGDYPLARATYTQAIEQFPVSSEAWAALGEHIRFYVHDADAAAIAFKKALTVEQQTPYAVAYALRGLGELEIKAGHVDDGIVLFKKSLAAFALADTHRSLCHLYCRQRKFKEAAEEAQAAVEINPDDAIARLLFAAQLHRSGQEAKANAEFLKALEIGGMDSHGETDKPVHCCVLYNAAGYLSVAGQNDAALKMLRRFFDTPNHRHLSLDDIVSDSDFDNLKNLSAFRALLASNFKEHSPESR
jgi:tetratricopeptide (TPR) repeat protein